MSATPRRAIVCSDKHWTAPVHLSSHHIAKFLLARGWHVAYVSTPTSPLHVLGQPSNPLTRQRFANWRAGGAREQDGRLFHYTPLALLPPSRLPFLNRRWVFEHWVENCYPNPVAVLADNGFSSPDLMITESALMLPMWRALGRPRLVYRVTDRNDDFPNVPPVLRSMEREFAAEAELVVLTGDRLVDYARRLSPRDTLVVGNGVELAHFERPRGEPAEYHALRRPRVLYVGMIADWFDVALLGELSERLPEMEFVIVGPGHERLAALASRSNIHLLGPRPYSEIPAYMQNADVGIIPFRRGGGIDDFVDDINPLKLYEYMAAGLPVVTAMIRQVAALDAPVAFAETPDAFAAAISRLASNPGPRYAEREFAARFDWTRQLEPLADRLQL